MHTEKDTQDTQWPIDLHTHKYTLKTLMCTHQLPVLHWMNNSLIQKLTEVHYAFAFKKLLICSSHISVDQI